MFALGPRVLEKKNEIIDKINMENKRTEISLTELILKETQKHLI